METLVWWFTKCSTDTTWYTSQSDYRNDCRDNQKYGVNETACNPSESNDVCWTNWYRKISLRYCMNFNHFNNIARRVMKLIICRISFWNEMIPRCTLQCLWISLPRQVRTRLRTLLWASLINVEKVHIFYFCIFNNWNSPVIHNLNDVLIIWISNLGNSNNLIYLDLHNWKLLNFHDVFVIM